MSEKKSIATRLSGILHNNGFLKILSVLLAVVVWIYILYVINPVNDKEFNRVSVDLSYEGSIPERNGYMYLLTDTNLTVSVSVSGSRSDLLNLTANDIKASLNLDPITTPGTHSVAVNISTGNKNLVVTDYNPKNFTIEFATKATRTLPIEIQASGSLPEGYAIKESSISPKDITIFGPANTVESIDKVYVSVPLTNVKTDITGTYDLAIVNKNGENVDRRFLTISDTKAESNLSVEYRKDMETTINVTNSSGGNESSYITVTLDTKTIQAIGDEKLLAGIETFSVGTIDTSKILENGVFPLTIPTVEGVVYSKDVVNATVEIAPDVGTKELSFGPKDIQIINLPDKASVMYKGDVKITIRAKASDLETLTTDNLKCQIDYKDKLEDGSFPIIIYPVAGNAISFGVVGEYSVTNEQIDIYEARSY
ncbi:MAG: hypothetical protein J6C26_04735 [Clostridia bacterium]|nr:hypothetical protein [Clostridia bacterium]